VLNKDPEGEEHETLSSAENEAIQSAREIMGEAVKSGRSSAKGKVFELTDAAGQVLSSIAFADVLQIRDDTSATAINEGGWATLRWLQNDRMDFSKRAGSDPLTYAQLKRLLTDQMHWGRMFASKEANMSVPGSEDISLLLIWTAARRKSIRRQVEILTNECTDLAFENTDCDGNAGTA
jgi:hypothetical protein